MPISLEVTGTERMLSSLNNVKTGVASPELVEKLASAAHLAMHNAAPVGIRGSAGLLRDTLSEVSTAQNTGDGWQIGVGNMEGIYPRKPAPKGTIAAFLQKWREEQGKPPRAERRTGTGFDPRKAWWYLSPEQKDRLREMREAGDKDVGGASPYRPFYWWVQEEGHPGAGIEEGQHYIEAAMNEIRTEFKRIVGEFKDVLRAYRAEVGASKYTRLGYVREWMERGGR